MGESNTTYSQQFQLNSLNKKAIPPEHAKNFQYINLLDLAYALADKEKFKKAKADFEKKIPKNGDNKWEILCTSQKDDGSLEHAYKAIAFINRSTKNIHIATAGTDFHNMYDLFDDVALVNAAINTELWSKKLSKQNAMLKFIDKILNIAAVKDYKFSTSGHSLGSAISDLTAAQLIFRGLDFTESITFENPGSKNWIKQYFDDKKVDLEYLASKCITYNARPNLINTSANQVFSDSAQLAEKLYVVHDNKLGLTKNLLPSSSFGNSILDGIINFIYPGAGLYSDAAKYANYVQSEVKKISQHSLDKHFAEAQFINEVDGGGRKWNITKVPLKINDNNLLALILKNQTPEKIKSAMPANYSIGPSVEELFKNGNFNISYPEAQSFEEKGLNWVNNAFTFQLNGKDVAASDDALIVYNYLESALVGSLS
jgi:hypothetical protein